MINAATARRNSTDIHSKAITSILSAIDEQITSVSQGGDYSVQFTITPSLVKCMDVVLNHLKSLGFNVKHEQGGDQRDSWNYLRISW